MNIQYVTDNKGNAKAIQISFKDWLIIKKQLNLIENKEPSQDTVLESIKQGLKEVKLMQQGKIKKKALDQLLNEL